MTLNGVTKGSGSVNVSPPDPSPSSLRVPDSTPAEVSNLGRLRMLSRIAEQVGEGVVVADNDGWFQYVNPEFAAQHAGTVEELTGAHLSSFYREEDLATQVQPVIAAALECGIGRGEVTRLRRDGTQFPARITLSLLRDDAGALIGRVLCVQDITEQRQLEEELRQAALYDPLTRLPNRRLLRDRVEHALVMRARGHTGVAALFVDLDSFKQVNDMFGHDVGDEVLVQVAGRLTQCVRACDTLARHGGTSTSCSLRRSPTGNGRTLSANGSWPGSMNQCGPWSATSRCRSASASMLPPTKTTTTRCCGRPTRPCTKRSAAATGPFDSPRPT